MIPEGSRNLYNLALQQTVMVGGMAPNPSVPLAMAIGLVVILIPYFFASVIVERLYLICHLKGSDPAKIRRATWKMNLVTYFGLMVFAVSNLVAVASESKNIEQSPEHSYLTQSAHD
jgi:hypothetical protein